MELELDLEPGRVLDDRFEIERTAGAGGMGRVYRARDRRSGATVAVKVLASEGATEAERFAREVEVEALAGLSHPAIVRFVTHGRTTDGEAYLVTEWLEGEDLGARLRRGLTLTIAESIALGIRAASGLAEAHARGVVHRDVKPANLWLVGGRPEDVKILDFGIARLRGRDDHTLTQAGALLGTPGYLAPEQARGDRRVDARADVFSLGCVLFKCLTGRSPFHAGDVMAVLLDLVLKEPPRLGDLCPGAPRALEDLIARMLGKTPEERPADGAAVARELAAIELDDSASGARPTATTSPALTTMERPLMCVALAQLGLDPDAVDFASENHELAAHGGELSALAGGSLLVTLASAGAFTDQAARAARCALALRARHAEAAVVVVAGRGERAARVPVGEVIDRGVALLRRTAKGAIRVDETIAGLVATAFDLRGDDAGLLLSGERAPFVGRERTLLGKPAPFVGRERELLTLEAIYDEVQTDEVARAVVITAPAGAGKSRLRHELIRRLRHRATGGSGPISIPGASSRHRSQSAARTSSEPPPRGREAGFELWLGRGDPLRAGSPFGLLATVIRDLAGVLDGEPIEVRRRKLAARVSRCVPRAAQARVTVFLGELAGVPFPDEEHVELASARRDALLMGDQLRRAFEEFLTAECAAGPVLVVIDDAQWGDRPSLSLLDAALRHLESRPLMIVALARPELDALFPNRWAGRPVTQIELSALSRKASERLVREVLGDAASEAVIARIVGLAGGDAFSLEELIRAVAEGEGERLPETVLAMAQHRLDGLNPQQRRVLRAASIFGGAFSTSGVLALLGGDERTPAVTAALADLAERELIHRVPLARSPSEDEHVFRQPLVREAAYAMLTDADRKLGHRLAGAWLAQQGESDAGVIAAHFERAGEP